MCVSLFAPPPLLFQYSLNHVFLFSIIHCTIMQEPQNQLLPNPDTALHKPNRSYVVLEMWTHSVLCKEGLGWGDELEVASYTEKVTNDKERELGLRKLSYGGCARVRIGFVPWWLHTAGLGNITGIRISLLWGYLEDWSATLNCICSLAMSASKVARLFLKSISLDVVTRLSALEDRDELVFKG